MRRYLLIFGLLLVGCDEPAPPPAPGAPSAAEIALAKQVLSQIQPLSIANNQEYCGYIGYDASGALVATPATTGDQGSCLAHEPPEDMRLTASYHTHGAVTHDYDSEVPSVDDLRSDIGEGVNGYIATPSGRVWLNEARLGQAKLLCGVGCITADPAFAGDEEFPAPAPVYTLEGLQSRSDG